MNSLKEISIETVSIWSFYKVLETRDYSIIEGTEKDWIQLYDEYFKEAGLKLPDWKLLQKYENTALKYITVRELINVLEVQDENIEDCKDALKKWKYIYDNKTSLESNLKRFSRNWEVLGTKLKMLEQELPENQQKLDIYQECIQMKMHFKFDIDPKITTCREWISLKNTYKQDARTG